MSELKKVNDEVIPETGEVKRKKPASMHEDIPVWYDCCSCEAEPYWVEAMNSEVPDKNNT